ncbi:MAG: RluA family pseudouridine synthase [Bdellovibrionota bacterium]
MSRARPRVIEFTVGDSDAGKRLDVLVTDQLLDRFPGESGMSRSQISQWISEGRVSLNGDVISKPAVKPKPGTTVRAEIPEPQAASLEPESALALSIVYEDDSILVLDKPAGLLVHPGAGNRSGTLANALVHHLGSDIQQIGSALRPGIVHRLDKETTGLLVVAKTEAAYRSLVRQLKPPRTMKRTYLAVTFSLPKRMPGSNVDGDRSSGEIDLPIGRHPTKRTRMAVVPGGKEAQTRWRIQHAYAHGYLLEVELGTGRTHQIRVHLSHCGAAIAGDPMYGSLPQKAPPAVRAALKALHRQALHAAKLEFIHPMTGKVVQFVSPAPADIVALTRALEA